jgi:hypothetical protein
MKLASHVRVVCLAPRQYISGTLSRGDICPSPPLSTSCERTPALQASGTIAVNDGTEGGSQKEPASRVAVVASVHANSLSRHLLLPSPLSTDSKEPMATEPTPTESTPTGPLLSAKEPAAVPTLTELKVKESTSPESSTVPTPRPTRKSLRCHPGQTPTMLHWMPHFWLFICPPQTKSTNRRRNRWIRGRRN